jgi:hypothetical protein
VLPVRWPDTVMINGFVDSPSAAGWPLHQASMQGSSLILERSFGADSGHFTPVERERLRYHLLFDGEFRTLGRYDYRIHTWQSADATPDILVREPSWFAGPSDGLWGGPARPPSPELRGIASDSLGRLWIVGIIPADTWRDAWAALDDHARRGRAETSFQPPYHLLFDSVVEVIDSRTGDLITSVRFPDAAITLLDDLQLVVYREDQDGVPRLMMFRLSLDGPAAGPDE